MTDDEISKVARDAFKHGTGFMRDGKHVPLEDVYMTVEDIVTDDLVKRLLEPVIDPFFGPLIEPIKKEAAARIEQLEAALRLIGEKAAELEDHVIWIDDHTPLGQFIDRELQNAPKGEKKDG